MLIIIATLYTNSKSNVPLYYHKRYQTEFWVQFLATRMSDFHIHAVESDGGPSCFSASSLKIKVAMSHSTWKMVRRLEDIHPEIWSAKQIFTQKFESPGFQIEHKINWKVDASSRGIQSKVSANHQIIFEKCSFRSNQHLRPRFPLPKSNSHAVCSTLIGCIL